MANPYQGDDEDPFSGARDKEGNIKRGSFKEAFAAARKAGDKTFTFNGKKYTTELKGAKKASARDAEVPPPMSTTSPASMTGKERASEMARIQARGGRDRLGESAAGRMIQRGMNRLGSIGSGSNEMGDEGMVGDVVGAKRGGSIKAKAKAKPKMSSASKRADGCAMKGKTRGRMI